MKLVFMGSGAFALPSLTALLDSSSHVVTALVTQPDKPAGRGHTLRPPATKVLALERGVPVHQPPKVRGAESVALLEKIAPECIVVVAYGQIIPKTIIEIPPKGIINVHGSLLPHYRGAAPIQWAIARGETETGVTTMLMDEGLDTGPMLYRETMPIGPDATYGTLEPELALVGARLLVRTLDDWAAGTIEPEPQDDTKATLAPRIKKEDARIDWSCRNDEIACRVRAFDPWPVSFTELVGQTLKVWKARAVSRTTDAVPGSIVALNEEGLEVACGDGTRLQLLEVQLAGRARTPAADFARGQRLSFGSQLGDTVG